jgi:hypothetical protein
MKSSWRGRRLATRQPVSSASRLLRPWREDRAPGQAADTTALLGLLDAVRVPHPAGVGRPQMRPNYLIADNVYGSRANRVGLRAPHPPYHPPSATTSGRIDRRRRGRRGGRPAGLCQEQYQRRKQVERGFAQREQHRALATRYDCEDIRVPSRAVV